MRRLVVLVLLLAVGCDGVIGDSLTNQAKSYLSGWAVAAQDGSYMSAAASRVDPDSQNEITVIALGSNDVKRGDSDEVMAASITAVRDRLNPATCDVWVDVTEGASEAFYPGWAERSASWNRVLRSLVSRVAAWSTFSAGHPEWFGADRLHFTDAGSEAYAGFITSESARLCP